MKWQTHFRLSLRDFLFLVLIVAISLTWWTDRNVVKYKCRVEADLKRANDNEFMSIMKERHEEVEQRLIAAHDVLAKHALLQEYEALYLQESIMNE